MNAKAKTTEVKTITLTLPDEISDMSKMVKPLGRIMSGFIKAGHVLNAVQELGLTDKVNDYLEPNYSADYNHPSCKQYKPIEVARMTIFKQGKDTRELRKEIGRFYS